MSSIQTPSFVLQGSNNQISNMRGKPRTSGLNSGVPATPRIALGEVSNFVRHPPGIEATPKLRSAGAGTHKPKQSSSDSDEFDEIETIRESNRDDCFEGIMNLSPVFSSAESFGELSDGGSDEEDEGYPPIEKMFIPPKGYDDFSLSTPDPEEKEIFASMYRDDDLVPMYISAQVKFIRNKTDGEEVEYEPMPDETLMAFDLNCCDF